MSLPFLNLSLILDRAIAASTGTADSAKLIKTRSTGTIAPSLLSQGQSEPTIKNTGDRWRETSSGGFPLYGWDWMWDGSRWRSPDFYKDFEIVNASAAGSQNILCNPAFNYHFRSLRYSYNVATTNNASNYWGIRLIRRPAGTAIGSNVLTSGGSAGSWLVSPAGTIDTFINVSSTSTTAFAIDYLKVAGSPGNLSAAGALTYNLVRL
jgi:hypothetical protein